MMNEFMWALTAAATVSGAIATIDEPSSFANHLKRQEPGSPAYSCHEACGQAILAARASQDVCSDDDFLANYDTCLKCSGPDNIDIWKIYGRTLSGFGDSCGLSTTPVSGQSPDTESTTSATPTSAGTTSSSSVNIITAAPTASETSPTGLVPINAADGLSGNVFGMYAVTTFGALYAIFIT